MNPFEKQEQIKASILASYNNVPTIVKGEETVSLDKKDMEHDIEKGGEGSRGGKVIGHTKSGKPVYESLAANHENYKDFSKEDHSDANEVHKKVADDIRANAKDKDDVSKKPTNQEEANHRSIAFHHHIVGEYKD